jgi:hypothetical protein
LTVPIVLSDIILYSCVRKTDAWFCPVFRHAEKRLNCTSLESFSLFYILKTSRQVTGLYSGITFWSERHSSQKRSSTLLRFLLVRHLIPVDDLDRFSFTGVAQRILISATRSACSICPDLGFAGPGFTLARYTTSLAGPPSFSKSPSTSTSTRSTAIFRLAAR